MEPFFDCFSRFLSTLSLRRATLKKAFGRHWQGLFLSTLSLRRATLANVRNSPNNQISIHALLAESDASRLPPVISEALFLSTLSLRRATAGFRRLSPKLYFYPRSPCGERQVSIIVPSGSLYFYPRSPCGERPSTPAVRSQFIHFYPRSPCGERLFNACCTKPIHTFLSTLSLRRATPSVLHGFRPLQISIHALLAESDRQHSEPDSGRVRFLSTLSLRRATIKMPVLRILSIFLSTLSLRRATSSSC